MKGQVTTMPLHVLILLTETADTYLRISLYCNQSPQSISFSFQATKTKTKQQTSASD